MKTQMGNEIVLNRINNHFQKFQEHKLKICYIENKDDYLDIINEALIFNICYLQNDKEIYDVSKLPEQAEKLFEYCTYLIEVINHFNCKYELILFCLKDDYAVVYNGSYINNALYYCGLNNNSIKLEFKKHIYFT